MKIYGIEAYNINASKVSSRYLSYAYNFITLSYKDQLYEANGSFLNWLKPDAFDFFKNHFRTIIPTRKDLH